MARRDVMYFWRSFLLFTCGMKTPHATAPILFTFLPSFLASAFITLYLQHAAIRQAQRILARRAAIVPKLLNYFTE